MSWYNYPTNISNIGELVIWANEETQHMFGNVILVCTFLIIFISLSFATKSSKALPVSTFITFIFSVLLIRMSIISPVMPFILIVATIIGIFWARNDSLPY